MRRLRPWLFVLLVAELFSAGAVAKEDTRRTPPPDGRARATSEGILSSNVTMAQVRAVRRGLAWLASRQEKDGSWPGEATLATTSLSVLAFMGQGNTETRGVFNENVREGVKFILRHVTRPGQVSDRRPLGYIFVKDDKYSQMHAHGYATLTLAMAYGMGSKERQAEIRDCLDDAVRLIEDSQDGSGGWYYQPERNSGNEGSVTVTQVQALRAARDAGIRVSALTIRNALGYLERSFDPKTGGFCYSTDDRTKHSYGLTAAALSTLFGLGQYEKKQMVEEGLVYMHERLESNLNGGTKWFFYSNLYAAQTLWQAGATTWGARYWQEWWPPMRALLLKNQKDSGMFGRPDFEFPSQDLGSEYRTAIACLILEVPYQLLPIFER